jgi:hypothetical protein
MPERKKKETTTLTFRINKEFEKTLREESKIKRISLNTLADQIFGEYVEWHRYSEKFGTIIMSRDAFKMLLDSLNEKEIVDLAIKIAEKAPKEFILFKWKKITPQYVINFLKMYFDHCGYGNYDYYESDEGESTFSIRHMLGLNGSLFLKTFFETVIKSILNEACDSTLTADSVVVSFAT